MAVSSIDFVVTNKQKFFYWLIGGYLPDTSI